MNSTITQGLAWVLILLSALKLAAVFADPRAWVAFARRLYANPRVTSAVALLVAAVILVLLIRSGLDIVEILAVCLFFASLLVVGIAPYAERLFASLETEDIGQLIKRQRLYVSVWGALLAWGLYTLLG